MTRPGPEGRGQTRASEVPRRAVLSVPASSAAMVAKASSRGADEILLDLEDGVAPARKESALAQSISALGTWPDHLAVAVRVNAIGTPWCHREIVALAEQTARSFSIVVPKVESAADLDFVDRLLGGAEGGPDQGRITVQALIETAPGLLRVGEIAGAIARLRALVLGYADLAASLGARPAPEDWLPAQQAVLTAARSHGLQAIDGPELDLESEAVCRRAAERARRLGFDGKWAIHPRQVPILLGAFTPSDGELAQARAVVDALQRAHAAGQGAGSHDGAMIDEATTRAAERTLVRAQAPAPEVT